ncbi:MAG TPA: SgcJ/EcaC family oxidoreductase [Pyrinomonadaceae bacterium]|nr:SgcJ/EcaC family oxidoreductase [Pyrinomonadaceae bacterium]
MMTNNFRAGVRLVVAVLLLSAGANPLFAGSGDAKLARAVRKANADWVTAVKTGDAATIAAPYADDAVFILADGTCIRGRAGIEKMYREGFERGGVAASARIDSRKLVVDGDLAYESGYGETGRIKEGKVLTRGGRYLTVWQRAADGDWKIIRNIVLP